MIKDEGETTQWSKMKERQPNDQRWRRNNPMIKDEGETTQWSKMKARQPNGQR